MAEDGLVVPSNGPARIEVLGPLRAWASDGRELTPSGALQRRLLALLVLRRGRAVPTDTLVEALWPHRRPDDPVAALQNHVARLRRILPDGALASTDAGYRLDPAAVDVDADRLLHLLAEAPDTGSSADTGSGGELTALLDRWHGPAYAELEEWDEARVEAARLEECRRRGHETLAEHRLQRGELDGLVTDLTALADIDPLRERPRALLMSALAATGRTAEALRVYDDFRRLLADELGIWPSPALAAQHAALLGDTEPAPASPRPIRTRLPVPTTGLVGREPLVAELVTLAGSHRLVSLIGPGGVGKTRLAIEVGGRLQGHRPDRPVVWCELAQADAASATDVVLAALGIDARPGVIPAARVVDVIGDDEIVVLLDNCEHVIDAAAGLVDDLLAGCPNLSILTTSRERLRLPGEQVRTVPTLLSGSDPGAAVDLFMERALAARPDFSPGAGECERIAEIVSRLDGLPLAIELAAARLHTLDLDEVAAGLDERFSLLSSGRRTSTRHGSLGAAVAWSFGLLPDDLQRCFAALSVFSRSFTPSDAAALCRIEASEAVEMLSQLVERSLVQRTPDRRYLLLETLREFGAGELRRSGDADRVSECHARWMVDWVEEADRALATPGRAVLADIDDAIPELRAALAWLLGHGLAEHASRLVHGLLNYGMMRLRPDVLAWADTVLAADTSEEAPPLAPELWAASAYAAWMVGDVPAAAERAARGLQAEEATGRRPVARVRTMLGNIDLFEGRLAGAADWYQQAIDASTGDPVEWLFSRATQLLALGYAGDPRAATLADGVAAEIDPADSAPAAYLWYCTGEAVLGFDVETARERLMRAVEMAERTNASFVRGVAGASKASIEARTGDPAVAVADYRWLIGHWRRAGVWSTQWTMLRSVATLLERVGHHTDAAVLEGAVRSTGAGHRIFGADAEALDALADRLRTALGDTGYRQALAQGARLDGDAAVEHALRALAQPVTIG